MAVEIPLKNVWQGQPVIVRSMREVAANEYAWHTYQALNLKQKEDFRAAISLPIVVSLSRVISLSQPGARPPAPVIVPTPESILAFQQSAADFKGWLDRQSALISGNAALRFNCLDAVRLGDGTISVPIVILRNNLEVPGTRFVFHYHPGASGPSVGHGHASEGHFKPFDGAAKYIRVEHHQCGDNLRDLRRAAQDKARALPG